MEGKGRLITRFNGDPYLVVSARSEGLAFSSHFPQHLHESEIVGASSIGSFT